MRASLSTGHPADGDRAEFRRIVLAARFRGSQKQPENLRIGFGGPASRKVQQQKNQQASEQASKEVESACAHAHGAEKKLPLRAQNGERARERSVYEVDSSSIHALSPSRRRQLAGEKPGEEVDRGDGHADAEEHTSEHTFRAAFPEGEGQAGNDDGHKRKAASNG